MAIHASAHTDDWRAEVEFDATNYFKASDDDTLFDLYLEGFGGCEYADWVAEWFWEERHSRKLTAFFNARAVLGCGFECYVDDEDAMRWISKNRPALAARIDAYEASQR